MKKLTALCLAALTLFVASPALAADLVVRAAEGFTMKVRVNGHPLRLRVDPEAPGFVVLNPGVARRIGLRPSLLEVEAIIGPVSLDGETKVALIEHEGMRFRRRVAWVEGDAAGDADGLVNPANLPFDRVIFELGPPAAGETEQALTMDYTREYGLRYAIPIGDRAVHFQFSTHKARSMATAAAGAQLAKVFAGAWTGDAFEALIEYGVRRPVRAMRLQQKVIVDGIPVSDFLVRTGDHRGANSLPSDSADPAEIVVTGPSGQKAIFMITLGLDGLSACSRLLYERAARRMTLRCRGGAGL
jgi:hypothetical protein